MIWSSLFTVGNFLYGRTGPALLLLGVGIVSGLVLIWVINQLWAKSPVVAREEAVVPSGLIGSAPTTASAGRSLSDVFFKHGQELLEGRGEDLVAAVNSAQRPEIVPFQRHGHQAALGHFLLERGLGHNSDAAIEFEGAFNRFDVIELHGVLHLDPLIAQELVQRLAGRQVRVEADEVLAIERLKLELRSLAKGWCG